MAPPPDQQGDPASSGPDTGGPLGPQLRQPPDLEDIVDLECLLCPGLVDRVRLEEVREAAHTHLGTLHPLEVAALRATGGHLDKQLDQHWRARPPVPVCEACYSILEPPYWEHVSTPPTHAGGFRDTSAQWLLCCACHELRIAGRPGAWVRHAWNTTTTRYPWLLRLPADSQLGARAELAGTIRLLLERLDQGQRLTL
jgi:hypothetical protein